MGDEVSELALQAGLVVGAVLVLAGSRKLASGAAFERTLFVSGLLPSALVPSAKLVVPALETLAGLLLLTGFMRPAGALFSVALLSIFVVGTWRISRSHTRVPCACFGTVGRAIDHGTVGRNILFLTYAAISVRNSESAALWAGGVLTSAPSSDALRALLVTLCLLLLPFVVAEAISLLQHSGSVLSHLNTSSLESAKHR